jgi:hypothetical protein
VAFALPPLPSLEYEGSVPPMAARVRGAVVLDLAAGDLPAARTALARAAAAGPLGRLGGRLELHTDGRASYDFPVGWAELARVLQSAGLAAATSAGASLGLGWMVHQAIPLGFALGVGWAVTTIARDRLRLHRNARALFQRLPRLLDAGREQPR